MPNGSLGLSFSLSTQSRFELDFSHSKYNKVSPIPKSGVIATPPTNRWPIEAVSPIPKLGVIVAGNRRAALADSVVLTDFAHGHFYSPKTFRAISP